MPVLPSKRPAGWAALAWATAALVPVLVYLPTLAYGFVYDDGPLVLQNPAIRDLSRLPEYFARDLDALWRSAETVQSNYYRPLLVTAMALLWKVGGTDPRVWHGAAVALHGLAGLLAMAALRAHGLSRGQALAGSLLFSLHPAHVDSVAWVSGLQDQVFGAMALAAYLGYRRAVREAEAEEEEKDPGKKKAARAGGAGASAAMAVAYAAALLAKEAAVGLLLFAGGEWAWTAVRRASPPGRVRHLAQAVGVLAAVTVAYLAVRWGVLGTPLARPFPTAPSPTAALASVPLAVLAYLGFLLWPVGLFLLSPLRPVAGIASGSALLGLAGVTGALVLAAFWVRRRPAAFGPCLWLGAWLAPYLNLWAINPEWMVVDRYLYLPVLALGWALASPETGPRPAKLRWGMVTVVGFAFAGLSLTAMPAYRDERAFWERAVQADPRSSVAWVERGRLLSEAGQGEAARAAFQRAAELDPGYLLPWLRLGNLAFAQGDAPEAVRAFRRALAMNPGYAPAWRNLPAALAAAGQPEEALGAARQAVERFPNDPQALSNLAVLLRNAGNTEEALALLGRARAAAPPGSPLAAETALREATLLAEVGRLGEALRAATEGLAQEASPEVRARLQDLETRLRSAGAR